MRNRSPENTTHQQSAQQLHEAIRRFVELTPDRPSQEIQQLIELALQYQQPLDQRAVNKILRNSSRTECTEIVLVLTRIRQLSAQAHDVGLPESITHCIGNSQISALISTDFPRRSKPILSTPSKEEFYAIQSTPTSTSTINDPTALSEVVMPFEIAQPSIKRGELRRENVSTVLTEWSNSLTANRFSTRSLFECSGHTTPAGVPKAFQMVPLYEKPLIATPQKKWQVHSLALGMLRSVWDAPPGVLNEWRLKDFPERRASLSDFEVNDHALVERHVSMYCKLHIVMPSKHEPWLAVNPIQYAGYRTESLRPLVKNRLQQQIEEVTHLKPLHTSQITHHLKHAMTTIEANSSASIFRYPARDTIAVALAINLAKHLGIRKLAFPSPRTLDITKQPKQPIWRAEVVIPIYNKLADFARRGNHELEVMRFSPELKLYHHTT